MNQETSKDVSIPTEQFSPLPFAELIEALDANAAAAYGANMPYTGAVYRSAKIEIKRLLDALHQREDQLRIALDDNRAPDEPPAVLGAGCGVSPMPTAVEAIEAHVRQIEMLCDATNIDPAQWLVSADESASAPPPGDGREAKDAARYRYLCSLDTEQWRRLAKLPDNEIDAEIDYLMRDESERRASETKEV